MAMAVKNNMAAINTLNRLSQNNSDLAKSLKKVSSGMRINSAGDDASGYSISEKMQARIRGLSQCCSNTKNGHDMLNLASQAVDNQVQIVSHLREIAMKASDDTYSQEDRDVLQSETNQMLMQLNDISWDTNYNGIRLLDGVTDKSTVERKMVASQGVFNALGPAQKNTTLSNLFPNEATQSYLARAQYLPDYDPSLVGYMPPSNNYKYTHTLDFSASGANVPIDFDNQGFSVLCRDCPQFISFTFTTNLKMGEGQFYSSSSDSSAFYIGIGGAQTYDDIENAIYDGVIYANNNAIRNPPVPTNTTLMNHHSVNISKDNNGNINITQSGNPPVFYQGTKGTVTPTPTYKIEEKVIPARYPYKDLYIQSDTPSSQNTRYQLYNTTLDALFPPSNTTFTLNPSKEDYPTDFSSDYANLPSITAKEQKWRDEVWPYAKPGAMASGSCVRTREKAQKFLDDIDQALKYLLHVNTSLGAQINRLDNATDTITTNNENTTAAESTIRDADMAKEMTNYTKHSVLAQTAQTALSQANQSSSGVLNLLQ